MTKVVFLGTNGWYDSQTGNTICTLIDTGKYIILLDAGNGLQRADKHISYERDGVFLFLSHFHLDHIIGLHLLSKFRLTKGLQIIGPNGTKALTDSLVRQPYTMPISDLPYPVHVHDFDQVKNELPFCVESKPLVHSCLTFGYRFEIDGKILTYCTDTGYCKQAVDLAHNADLLIAECAYGIGQTNDKWPHLNPELAGKLAAEANAKRLALVHFDAFVFKTKEDRLAAQQAARQVFDNTFAAFDDMAINV